MQTHEWEALLDGITPGPWEAREDHGGINLFAGSERVFGSDACGDVSGEEEDVRLAAAAPDAVAEVIRLRKAIEAVRDDYQRSAEVDHLLSQFSVAPVAPVFNDLVDILTRTLEGVTDE